MPETKPPYWQTLPDGFHLLPMPHENRIYITYKGRMVVTKETGSPRFFKGTDEATRISITSKVNCSVDGPNLQQPGPMRSVSRNTFTQGEV